MAEKFKYHEWNDAALMSFAERRVKELNAEVRAQNEKIQTLSDKVFRDPEAGRALIAAAEKGMIYGFRDVLDDLKNDPASYGRLQGNPLFGEARTTAEETLKQLPAHLSHRAELQRTREDFEKLGDAAAVHHRLPRAMKEDALRTLRNHAEYCESNYHARDIIYRDSIGEEREPSDDPGGGGGGGGGGSEPGGNGRPPGGGSGASSGSGGGGPSASPTSRTPEEKGAEEHAISFTQRTNQDDWWERDQAQLERDMGTPTERADRSSPRQREQRPAGEQREASRDWWDRDEPQTGQTEREREEEREERRR